MIIKLLVTIASVAAIHAPGSHLHYFPSQPHQTVTCWGGSITIVRPGCTQWIVTGVVHTPIK